MAFLVQFIIYQNTQAFCRMYSIWRAPFQKGLGPFFMKVDVFGLIYRFWVALFAKTNEKEKLSLESG